MGFLNIWIPKGSQGPTLGSHSWKSCQGLVPALSLVHRARRWGPGDLHSQTHMLLTPGAQLHQGSSLSEHPSQLTCTRVAIELFWHILPITN